MNRRRKGKARRGVDRTSKGKAKKGTAKLWLSPAGKRLDRPGDGYAKNSVELPRKSEEKLRTAK